MEILGVDFSVKECWVTRAKTNGNILEVQEIFQCNREKLKEYIERSNKILVGQDFPFSFPKDFLITRNIKPLRWDKVLQWNNEIDDIRSEIKNFCELNSPHNKHPKRECDKKYKDTLSPLNIRIAPMTHYGMKMIYELRNKVKVLPWDSLDNSSRCPYLIEVFPGSIVRVIGENAKSYKHSNQGRIDTRIRILSEITRKNDTGIEVRLQERNKDYCIGSDDALDSVLASIATATVKIDEYKKPEFKEVEGFIFGP